MSTIEVRVPDIGDFEDVPVIEVHVKPGDLVKREDSLVTLESEKATFDLPAPSDGKVKEMSVKVGDRVSEGSLVLTLEAAAEAAAPPSRPRPQGAPDTEAAAPQAPISSPPLRGGEEEKRAAPSPPREERAAPPSPRAPPLRGGEGEEKTPEGGRTGVAHASPSIRRFARELGVDLSRVDGTGPRGRILRQDVARFVSEELERPGGRGLDVLPWPKVDFARYGPVDRMPLSRIRRLSAANLARNWVMIPHVTQHDEADVTDLEAFRIRLNEEGNAEGVKVTLLAFVVKACVAALRRFPEFNASLDGEDLVVKRYFHIGFAADTPSGLVVPVLRDADKKGVLEIAGELAALAARAREGKLGPADVQGGTFSISSLGGIGGTAFTPIINAPEVAILGVSRASTRPVWNGKSFAPRLVLPLSLSYDHRVIDGAAAARFTVFLAQVLADARRALL